jgi:hypothetical protein
MARHILATLKAAVELGRQTNETAKQEQIDNY